jgi:cyclohexyl-isocyanide hydratase
MTNTNPSRRDLAKTAGTVLAASTVYALGATPARAAGTAAIPPVVYSSRPRPGRHTGSLSIGCLIFPRLDQIDFTGPFEVLARVPDVDIQIVAKTVQPVKDVKGLILTPTLAIADAPMFDVLVVAGGLGQQVIMDDPEIMGLIRRHMDAGRIVFSVCTGALLCGAAGILKGREATTHWSAIDLLKYYGAKPINARVVVDGNLVTAAGVTAGLDGALLVASLLRGAKVAEEAQLNIQYAPNPVFHSGEPATAAPDVKASFLAKYEPDRVARQAEAVRFAGKLGVTVPRNG